MINETKNKMRKIVNRTLAMLAAAPAILLKPRIPAMSAMIKNISVQLNIDLIVTRKRHAKGQMRIFWD